jgi:hypothetical protein
MRMLAALLAGSQSIPQRTTEHLRVRSMTTCWQTLEVCCGGHQDQGFGTQLTDRVSGRFLQ